MTLSSAIKDNEAAKFRDAGLNKTKVAIVAEGDVNGLLSGVQYDDIQATYPTSTTELYSYYLSSSLVAEIQITYTNASKTIFTRAQRV